MNYSEIVSFIWGVADCFKFRNRIGLEAAIEAARECLREKKASSDEVYHYGKICRVWNVMKPYLEALSCR